MVIGLVSSVLLVVLICTAAVIALYCHARRRNKRDSSSSQSTSWLSNSDVSLPRIPRANLVEHEQTAARLPQRNGRVWQPNRTGTFSP